MPDRSRVVADRDILSGTPIVAGTRIPAGNVLAELRAGSSRFEVFRHYPSLPPDGIEACLEWEREQQGR